MFLWQLFHEILYYALLLTAVFTILICKVAVALSVPLHSQIRYRKKPHISQLFNNLIFLKSVVLLVCICYIESQLLSCIWREIISSTVVYYKIIPTSKMAYV